MAHIRIRKAAGGLTSVEFDDARGLTRFRKRSGPIQEEDLGVTVLAMATEWQDLRAAIKAARKKKVP